MIGGAVAAVSYGSNWLQDKYLKKNQRLIKYTTTDDIPVDTSTPVNSSLENMIENIKNARSNYPQAELEMAKVESDYIGLSGPNGLMMGPEGKFNALGTTEFNPFTGRSKILYSARAASNTKLLGKVMSHETAHAYSYALGIPNLSIEVNMRFSDALDSVEHLAIRKLEYTYAFKNNILDYRRYYVDMIDISKTVLNLTSSQRMYYNFMYSSFYNLFNITYKFP